MRVRSDLQGAAQSLTSPSAAPGQLRAYETVLWSMVPRFAEKLESSVLRTGSREASYAFFESLVFPKPETASPSNGQPVVCWDCVTLGKAAVAFWNVVGGPRTGAFWSGINRSRVQAAREKSPLLLIKMLSMRDKGAMSLHRFRQAVAAGKRPIAGVGLGASLEDGMTFRSTASTPVAVSGVCRASEVS